MGFMQQIPKKGLIEVPLLRAMAKGQLEYSAFLKIPLMFFKNGP